MDAQQVLWRCLPCAPLTFSWPVGRAEEVVEGLDLAVMKMKKGERVLLTVGPENGYGAQGSEQPLAVVPPGATVEFEVELVEFENAKASWELDESGKVESCGAIKASGNELFKRGANERALKKYGRALALVEHESSFKDATVAAEAMAMKKSCLLNKAAVLLRLKRHSEVVIIFCRRRSVHVSYHNLYVVLEPALPLAVCLVVL
jgi:FK506-binding protein 4/5